MALSFSSLNILSILPMCLIAGGGILILIVDIILNKFNKTLCIGISSISIALSFLSILDLENTTIGFYSLISIDGLSVLSQMIILIASLFFIFLATIVYITIFLLYFMYTIVTIFFSYK